jgi:hypothetical protein
MGNENAKIRNIYSADDRQSICLDILHMLPEWFGNEAAVIEYGQQCRALPFFAAFEQDRAIGFVALSRCIGMQKIHV